MIEEYPDAAAAAVRAVVKTQKALRADPGLSSRVAQRLFPPEEAELLPALIARDAEFYDATISPEAVDGVNAFAHDCGLLAQRTYPYDQVVATQFSHLWKG